MKSRPGAYALAGSFAFRGPSRADSFRVFDPSIEAPLEIPKNWRDISGHLIGVLLGCRDEPELTI